LLSVKVVDDLLLFGLDALQVLVLDLQPIQLHRLLHDLRLQLLLFGLTVLGHGFDVVLGGDGAHFDQFHLFGHLVGDVDELVGGLFEN
jgi:hypothetical protein